MNAGLEFHLRGDVAATTLSLEGELTIARLDAALDRLNRALRGRQVLEIDLAGLQRADSAALALLLDLVGRARAAGKAPPRIMGLPTHLQELLSLYHLQNVLSVS